jgi:exportin-7
LLKQLTANWVSVADGTKDEMKNFLLNLLAQRGPEMMASPAAASAVSPLVRLLCRLVKLSWLEGPQHQNITDHVQKFMNATTAHWVLGLEIYTELVADMQPQVGPSMQRYRRTALSFRDTALPNIF